MFTAVKVVSVEDAGFFQGQYTSGSTVKVTMTRDTETVICDGILIWENDQDADALDELFDEWVSCALEGEEGYTYFDTALSQV